MRLVFGDMLISEILTCNLKQSVLCAYLRCAVLWQYCDSEVPSFVRRNAYRRMWISIRNYAGRKHWRQERQKILLPDTLSASTVADRVTAQLTFLYVAWHYVWVCFVIFILFKMFVTIYFCDSFFTTWRILHFGSMFRQTIIMSYHDFKSVEA